MNKRVPTRIWVIAGLLFGLFLILSVSGKDEPAAAAVPAKPIETASAAPVPMVAPKPALELLSKSGERGEYSTTITGRIRNNTNHAYGYVQVTFNLYNKADEQVGTAFANVNNLEPGGVWKFKAVGMERDGYTFKLGEITGF